MHDSDDRLVEQVVTYSIEYGGRSIIVGNVPARVDPETGEQDTVERLQAIVWNDRQPDPIAETPVFQFAAQP